MSTVIYTQGGRESASTKLNFFSQPRHCAEPSGWLYRAAGEPSLSRSHRFDEPRVSRTTLKRGNVPGPIAPVGKRALAIFDGTHCIAGLVTGVHGNLPAPRQEQPDAKTNQRGDADRSPGMVSHIIVGCLRDVPGTPNECIGKIDYGIDQLCEPLRVFGASIRRSIGVRHPLGRSATHAF